MKLQSGIIEKSSARLAKFSAKEAAPERQFSDRFSLVEAYVESHRRPTDEGAYERAIGSNDLVGMDYLWDGIQTAQSVARIVIPPTDVERGSFATGFCLAPNLFITNWHVFENESVAARSRIQFDHETALGGREEEPTYFRCDPNQFFVSDEGLDYCVLFIDPQTQHGPRSLEGFGWLRLNPRLGKTDYGQYVSIIQHPGGQLKQIAIRENEILEFDELDDFLPYQSDTFRGSSGSPVLNDFWDVVALHSAGRPLKDEDGNYVDHSGQPIIGREPQEHEVKWIANEGGRVSRIVSDLMQRESEYPQWQEHWDNLKASFAGEIRPRGNDEVDVRAGEERATVSRSFDNQSNRRALIDVPLGVTITLNESDRAESKTPYLVTNASPYVSGETRRDRIESERLNFDRDYDSRRGYDEYFLGAERRVPMPRIAREEMRNVARLVGGGSTLHYHHFSIRQHRQYRLPILSACNVDYRASSRDDRSRDDFGRDQWIYDERLRTEHQLPPGFYDRWRRIDYGHLVRRDDNVWGASAEEIEFANADTFHMTNCTPQHEDFNRDIFQYNGLWGQLENQISRQASRDRIISRMCIFSGPIFLGGRRDLLVDDSVIGEVRIPRSYWKVVVAATRRGSLRSYGFILSQDDDLGDDPPFEDFSPRQLQPRQRRVSMIEEQTDVRFSDKLKNIDVLRDDNRESIVLSDVEEIWHGEDG